MRLMGSERGRRANTTKTTPASPRTATPASQTNLLESGLLLGVATPVETSCDGGAGFCDISTGAGFGGLEASAITGDAVSGLKDGLVTGGSFGMIGAASAGCCSTSDGCSTFRSTMVTS